MYIYIAEKYIHIPNGFSPSARMTTSANNNELITIFIELNSLSASVILPTHTHIYKYTGLTLCIIRYRIKNESQTPVAIISSSLEYQCAFLEKIIFQSPCTRCSHSPAMMYIPIYILHAIKRDREIERSGGVRNLSSHDDAIATIYYYASVSLRVER